MIPIINTLLFFLALALILGAGFVLWRFLFAGHATTFRIETLLFSFALGITLIDFSLIAFGRAAIPFSGGLIVLCLLSSILLGSLWQRFALPRSPFFTANHNIPLLHSRRTRTLFFILFALTLGIKTLYLSHAIIPTATDLGHHLYWAKTIVETKTLPVYQERAVIDPSPHEDTPSSISLSPPTPIADFIIGEHLPLAALAFLTGENFFSAFPVVFLLLINLLGLLTLVVLTYRLVESSSVKHFISPELACLVALLLFGPLYTLASPQAKFVSGGVIGNVFGNFFLPLILLLFFRAIQEKNSRFLGLGFLLTFTLAYTHHLSTLILLYTLVGILCMLILSYLGHLKSLFANILSIVFQPTPLIVALIATLFFFSVAMPTYIETHAVGTALGTPTKLTRIGLSFHQMTETAGGARFALGLIGLFLLATTFRRSLAASIIIGWTVILFCMSYHPDWLFLNIPSNRIGTYFSFPMGIAAALGFAWIITITKKKLHSPLSLLILITTSIFTLSSGFFDDGQSLLATPKSKEAVETFAASAYLARSLHPNDIVLKDHNYIIADAWMKHFFMRDYSFPLSRGYFGRYESSDRERCTLDMIAIPNTPRAQNCFKGIGVNYIVVNPQFDAPQFEKSPDFSRIYVSNTLHIYAR